MCIRDRVESPVGLEVEIRGDDGIRTDLPDDPRDVAAQLQGCLLYTSDAADERSSVDLGGRRIIKKKNKTENRRGRV